MNNAKLTNEEKKELNNKRVPMDLSVFEMEAIKILRTINFGRITIVMFDGIPTKYETQESKFFLTETNSSDTLSKLK